MIYAGFWKRFLACLLDGFFIWMICLITIIPYLVTPLCIVIAAFYHVVFETSPLRSTPGKALLKMSVVKSNGSQLTIKDSLIRFVMTFISSALLCFGYLMALFTDKKQTLHDFVADTIVIQETFAENNFWQIFLMRSKEIFKTEGHPTERDMFAPPSSSSTTQSLEDIYNLYQKGILSEEEYKLKKEEYLRRL